MYTVTFLIITFLYVFGMHHCLWNRFQNNQPIRVIDLVVFLCSPVSMVAVMLSVLVSFFVELEKVVISPEDENED